jgi:cyclophilin family peptidyl-prolyl cis-trans isomerase
VLAQIHKDYPEDVRIVFRPFPLIGTHERPFHDKAALSMQASEAAGAQGKFWEMHDLLFERQSEWVTMTVSQFQDWLIARTGDLKLDSGRFSTDLTSKANVDKAQKAWNDGMTIGLPGTPFVLVNRKIWPQDLPLDYGSIIAIIKLTQLEEKQFTSCPPMTIDPKKQYVATLHTKKGNIVMDLYPDRAPLAVNSFVFLARQGWFDGVMFHRVLPGMVAQAGDPTGTGFGGPGYAFDNEIASDLKFDAAGVVGMANAGPGSNGSQFFIALAPRPDWTGSYTIFGKVISGLDVVQNLTPRDPSQPGVLPDGDIIESVTIDEK